MEYKNKRRQSFVLAAFLVVCALFGSTANAHIVVTAPNGGEVLVAGQTVKIEWGVLIQHDTQNWDITYSVTGENGPWLEIATDLPLGDPSPSSIHDYIWTVPENYSNQVRVRVVQDNVSSFDYEDQSNADLSIVCCIGSRGNVNADSDDKTNISDITYLTAYLFGVPSGPAPACPAEGNVNGDVDEKVGISDITYLVAFLFGVPAGPPPPACPQ